MPATASNGKRRYFINCGKANLKTNRRSKVEIRQILHAEDLQIAILILNDSFFKKEEVICFDLT